MNDKERLEDALKALSLSLWSAEARVEEIKLLIQSLERYLELVSNNETREAKDD